MIIHLLADYSRQPELRRELASNPEAVFDRYEISPYVRQALLSGNRSEIVRLLHFEIDDYFGGLRDLVEIIWIDNAPKILGVPDPESGPEDTMLRIRVTARNLANNVELEFYRGEERVEARIVEITTDEPANISQIHCRARFPNAGVFGCRVTNVVHGERYSDERDHFFTVTTGNLQGI